MAINFSDAVKNARLQAICDAIDAKATNLVLLSVTQRELCILPFPTPSKLSIIGGVLTFKNIDESMVLLDAEATHAKITDIDNVEIASLSVGVTGSGADLQLPSTTLFAGSLLRLNGWTITEL